MKIEKADITLTVEAGMDSVVVSIAGGGQGRAIVLTPDEARQFITDLEHELGPAWSKDLPECFPWPPL